MRLMHEKEVLTTGAGLSIICLHPPDDVREGQFLDLLK